MKNEKQDSQGTHIRNDRLAVDEDAPVRTEPLPSGVQMPQIALVASDGVVWTHLEAG